MGKGYAHYPYWCPRCGRKWSDDGKPKPAPKGEAGQTISKMCLGCIRESNGKAMYQAIYVDAYPTGGHGPLGKRLAVAETDRATRMIYDEHRIHRGSELAEQAILAGNWEAFDPLTDEMAEAQVEWLQLAKGVPLDIARGIVGAFYRQQPGKWERSPKPIPTVLDLSDEEIKHLGE